MHYLLLWRANLRQAFTRTTFVKKACIKSEYVSRLVYWTVITPPPPPPPPNRCLPQPPCLAPPPCSSVDPGLGARGGSRTALPPSAVIRTTWNRPWFPPTRGAQATMTRPAVCPYRPRPSWMGVRRLNHVAQLNWQVQTLDTDKHAL